MPTLPRLYSMTKRNKHKNAWKFWTAVLVAMCIPLLLAHFYGLWRVDASELIDPSPYKTVQLPTPTADPLPPLEPGVKEAIEWMFKDKGQRVVNEALKVAKCESSFKETASNLKNKNKTRDDGTFQVNSVHGVPAKFLHNKYVNIAVARQLYEEWGSWEPWRSSNKCHHLLPERNK